MKRFEKISLAMLAAVLVLGLLLGVLRSEPARVDAAESQAGASWPITVNTAAIEGNTTFTARQWNYAEQTATTAEIWYSIDQGTTNTMTLYLDASPDNSIWKTGVKTVVSANEADASGYETQTIVGRYFRIRATVANTNTITPTIKVVLK
ncbi:MAG: hypothetical protein DRI81_16265 [Chloroflexi bacterium]|nr:MAG: hypothetical protein DRI81_16265 [Chloroflexota bacterium]